MPPTLRTFAATAALALVGCADDPPPPPGPPPPAVLSFEGDYTPVDDGANVPGWETFRDSLRATLARRDTAALLAAVAPDARLSFEEETLVGGIGLRDMWFRGVTPEGRDPWRTLAGVLDGGSLDEDGAVIAPFVTGLWPEEHDPLSSVAIVEADVPARESPMDSSTVVATVSHLILPALALPEDGWRMVQLPDGRAAYVVAGQALSPIGYRATFWPELDGTWKLRSFLAGE
ncbi:MAG: hypothetical protein AAGI52_17395 [Bacteroidota bacterium]